MVIAELTKAPKCPFENITSEQKRGYVPAIDGLRAICALFVVLHHVWLESWPRNIYSDAVPHGTMKLFTGWLAFGHTAITVFIAVSGFCLMLPIAQGKQTQSFWHFMKRRALRILPPYYAALALSFVAIAVIRPNSHTIFDLSLPVTVQGAIAHLFLLHNIIGNQFEINGPLWSIAVEFQIYLFFPLFLYMRRRLGMWSVLTASFVVGFGVCRVTPQERSAHFLFVFTLGMLAAHLSTILKEPKIASRVAMLTIPIAVFVGIAGHPFGKDFTDFFVGLASCALLLLLTLSPQNIFMRVLSTKRLVFLGTFSYSLYLVHFPLLQIFWQAIPNRLRMNPSSAFLIDSSLGTTFFVIVAYAFHLVFEKPFMKPSRVPQGRAMLPKLHEEIADTVTAIIPSTRVQENNLESLRRPAHS